MKKLSIQDRNLLLTGDPYFRFDPIVYDCCFFVPHNCVPLELQQQLPHVIPDAVDVEIQVPQDVPEDVDMDRNEDTNSSTGFETDNDEAISESSETENVTFDDAVEVTVSDDEDDSNAANFSDLDPNSPKPKSNPKCVPPCTPPQGARARHPPSVTRSGRPYGPSSGAGPSGPKRGFSRFVSQAARTGRELMDSLPLAPPPSLPASSKGKRGPR